MKSQLNITDPIRLLDYFVVILLPFSKAKKIWQKGMGWKKRKGNKKNWQTTLDNDNQ